MVSATATALRIFGPASAATPAAAESRSSAQFSAAPNWSFPLNHHIPCSRTPPAVSSKWAIFTSNILAIYTCTRKLGLLTPRQTLLACSPVVRKHSQRHPRRWALSKPRNPANSGPHYHLLFPTVVAFVTISHDTYTSLKRQLVASVKSVTLHPVVAGNSQLFRHTVEPKGPIYTRT